MLFYHLKDFRLRFGSESGTLLSEDKSPEYLSGQEDGIMFLFKNHTRKTVKHVSVYENDRLVYNGKWEELPFTEKIMIEYSIRFFDDPTPCFIHRDAVRVRLLAELEESYAQKGNTSEWLEALSKYMELPAVTKVVFSDR